MLIIMAIQRSSLQYLSYIYIKTKLKVQTFFVSFSLQSTKILFINLSINKSFKISKRQLTKNENGQIRQKMKQQKLLIKTRNLNHCHSDQYQQNNSRMQREKLHLPGLYPPLASSRITTMEDYRQWEKQKKKAYRAELQQEIEWHNRIRQKSNELKFNQRANLNTLVQAEQKGLSLQRSTKIKTEQKYMEDNYSLMKQQSKSPRKIAEQHVYKQHPFVNLIQKEQKRKEVTKNSFIYQNKLNDLQSEMKRSMKQRKKLFEAEQRKKYIDHVEQEFNKHQQQRRFFQNKYLKIDKSNKKNFKKEHLEFLRDQASSQKGQIKQGNKIFTHRLNEEKQGINATGGNIGLTPIHHDRKRQLQTLQKSLKLFSASKPHLESSLSVCRQQEITKNPRPTHYYQKMTTEKSYKDAQDIKEVAKTERAQSSLNNNANTIKYKPIISQLSNKQMKPPHQRRQYKQYDIINGAQKIFVR